MFALLAIVPGSIAGGLIVWSVTLVFGELADAAAAGISAEPTGTRSVKAYDFRFVGRPLRLLRRVWLGVFTAGFLFAGLAGAIALLVVPVAVVGVPIQLLRCA